MKRTPEELDDNIKNMEEYQRKYFPNDVGVTCPYCGNKLDKLHHSVFYDRRTGDNKDSSL